MQEVKRSALSSDTPQVVWCASPAGYTCAITSRMHTVCDERGNYSFKSVGSLVGRPRPCQGRSKQAARWSLGIIWGASTCVCIGCSCTQTVWALSTQSAQALSNSCRAPMTLMWFRGSRSKTDRNYAHWLQRMETYVLHMHGCVQLLASLLLYHGLRLWSRARNSNFEWSLKWKGGHYMQCTFAHLMHDWTRHRRVVLF